ncbi:MAG TPA: DNA mismatch repair endonuclease MutL [Dehalococcoidia bacterium]|nr:DNA mismatch repair endonuclease MutL [Dehalococcoidia bacterium]
MPIRILPPEVARRIAAGEVVERPASVVKELLENSLDAGATRVSVEIAEGGTRLIRVTDNGCGIESGELELAFRRHATSKLEAEDLGAIATLGFRGEALPSIAAVSDVEAVSRTAGAPSATLVRLEAGEVVESRAAAGPAGTSIAVRNLFRRQPARLKFLRSASAEAGQIATVVSHYALAYPEVAFSLVVDGRETFATSGSGSRREAVSGVYGSGTAAAMIEVSESSEDHSLEALIGAPGLSRASRSYITIFINRRWVRSRTLAFAVEEAYRGLLPAGRYPIAIVDLHLPPSEVDVNVHPAKAEVRLRDERRVFGLVQRPIRAALAGMAAPSYGAAPAWPRAQPLASSWAPDEPAGVPHGGPPQPEVEARQQPLPTRIPVLRPLGQAGTTYVIAEGPAGLYLIDQHAAHERVLFERIRAGRQGGPPAFQGLLAPATLELTPQQEALLDGHREALRSVGFEVEAFAPGRRHRGPGGYILRAVPPLMKADDPGRAFTEVLDLLTREDAPADPLDRLAASLACHAAVRAGHSLSVEEMRDLLRQLEDCETPQTCPHGRPTMLHLSADELARRFARR